jgi:hypothetical protein
MRRARIIQQSRGMDERYGTEERTRTSWRRWLGDYTDLALGLMLSLVLGSVVGLTLGHPFGHLLASSALGAMFLTAYVGAYSVGAIRMMGAQQGLVVVTAFVWCVLVSLWLGPHPDVSFVVVLFYARTAGAVPRARDRSGRSPDSHAHFPGTCRDTDGAILPGVSGRPGAASQPASCSSSISRNTSMRMCCCLSPLYRPTVRMILALPPDGGGGISSVAE